MGKEKLQRQAGNSYHYGLGNNIAFTVGDCMRLPDETGTVPRHARMAPHIMGGHDM